MLKRALSAFAFVATLSFASLAACVWLLAISTLAQAQDYPSRAVTIISDSAAGSTPDAVAPASTPAAIVKKLNTALREIIDSPDVQTRFKNVGFEGFSSTPEELGAFIKVQLGVWEKMAKDADIKPN